MIIPSEICTLIVAARQAGERFMAADMGDHQYTDQERQELADAYRTYVRATAMAEAALREWWGLFGRYAPS